MDINSLRNTLETELSSTPPEETDLELWSAALIRLAYYTSYLKVQEIESDNPLLDKAFREMGQRIRAFLQLQLGQEAYNPQSVSKPLQNIDQEVEDLFKFAEKRNPYKTESTEEIHLDDSMRNTIVNTIRELCAFPEIVSEEKYTSLLDTKGQNVLPLRPISYCKTGKRHLY